MSSSASRPSARHPQAIPTGRRSSWSGFSRSNRSRPIPDRSSNIPRETRRHDEPLRINDHFAQAIDDSMDHVIVALDMRDKEKVGCAYYVASEERLLCMEEVTSGGIEVVEKCMLLSLGPGMSATH